MVSRHARLEHRPARSICSQPLLPNVSYPRRQPGARGATQPSPTRVGRAARTRAAAARAPRTDRALAVAAGRRSSFFEALPPWPVATSTENPPGAAACAPPLLQRRAPCARVDHAHIALSSQARGARRRVAAALGRSSTGHFFLLGEKRPGASRRARPGLRRAHSSSARSRRAHPVRGPRAPGAPGRRERGARALRTTAPFPLETAAWKMIGAPPSRPRAPLVTRAPAAPAPCLGRTRGGRARAHRFEQRGYSGGPVGVDGGERARPGCQFLSCTPSGLFSELARCFVSLSMSVSSARIHTHGAHKGAGRADVVGDGRKQKCRIPESKARLSPARNGVLRGDLGGHADGHTCKPRFVLLLGSRESYADGGRGRRRPAQEKSASER